MYLLIYDFISIVFSFIHIFSLTLRCALGYLSFHSLLLLALSLIIMIIVYKVCSKCYSEFQRAFTFILEVNLLHIVINQNALKWTESVKKKFLDYFIISSKFNLCYFFVVVIQSFISVMIRRINEDFFLYNLKMSRQRNIFLVVTVKKIVNLSKAWMELNLLSLRKYQL
jgi:hypothetical protein